jgi:hypothetical protein
MIRLINRLASGAVVGLVWVYRHSLRYLVIASGTRCRFHPTCSQYMLDAVAKHGPWKGFCKGLWRVCRCNPWGGSGHDPA